jgi:hypothetical protein
MRVDKNNPWHQYNNFGDWLQTDKNIIWIITLPFGYLYYIMTTYEV